MIVFQLYQLREFVGNLLIKAPIPAFKRQCEIQGEKSSPERQALASSIFRKDELPRVLDILGFMNSLREPVAALQ
jgi:hypothetical protein